jgi:hypothetical protein
MPALSDLTNEQAKQYLEIEEIVRARRGHCSGFDRVKLLELYKLHGGVKLLFVIDQSMMNDWLLPGRWIEFMDVVNKYGIDRVLFATKALNRLENHSIAMVENICKDPKLAERKRPGMKDEAPRPISPTQQRALIYPTKEGVHTETTAAKWLREQEKGVEAWPEFFDKAGSDEVTGWRLYQLKPEYR